MRGRVPFKDAKRQTALQEEREVQDARGMLLALARRTGVNLPAPHLVCLLLSLARTKGLLAQNLRLTHAVCAPITRKDAFSGRAALEKLVTRTFSRLEAREVEAEGVVPLLSALLAATDAVMRLAPGLSVTSHRCVRAEEVTACASARRGSGLLALRMASVEGDAPLVATLLARGQRGSGDQRRALLNVSLHDDFAASLTIGVHSAGGGGGGVFRGGDGG